MYPSGILAISRPVFAFRSAASRKAPTRIAERSSLMSVPMSRYSASAVSSLSLMGSSGAGVLPLAIAIARSFRDRWGGQSRAEVTASSRLAFTVYGKHG